MAQVAAGRRALALTLAFVFVGTGLRAADTQLQVRLPLGRTAYQTNEFIHVSVARSSTETPVAGELGVTLTGDDGSKAAFTFPLEARSVTHLQLNGWLLRPGHYALEAVVGRVDNPPHDAAKVEFDVCSHIRKSSFKLLDWGCRAAGPEQALLGEDSVGFNVLLASYGGISPDDMIRGGVDYMRCCTMGGAHQMDIRMECDWSDPYVLHAAVARVAREALAARLNPNAIGVHFYDEPGLTWWKHPKTGEMTPFNIPAQDRSYKAAFGVDAPQYCDVNPDDPKDFARWLDMNRWKESFIEAAWKHSAFAVRQVRADFLPANQSVYGYSAYADGYYFNAARSLPVMCGHGGYDDFGLLYFNPSLTFEFGRMRDLAKPNWYLPTWYGGTPSNLFRLEQYLSFMGNLQGMMKPPDMVIHRPSQTGPTADGIVESNKLMGRIGTIFTTMPVTRPEVALLYSLSQALASEVREMKKPDSQNVAAYEGGGHTRSKCELAYLAGQLAHTPFMPIVEEDVLDGTLSAHHKAIFLAGVNYLDPKVITVLEAYAASGGAVLVSDDSQVQIKGAVKLGVPVDVSIFDNLNKLWKESQDGYHALNKVGALYAAAMPLAKALGAKYRQLGIKPVLDCDNPAVVVSRQALGDMEYLFAVNACYGEQIGERNSIKAAAAVISLPADGRPVYDAIVGGPVSELKARGQTLSGQFRFGPGQMRVFARPARPVGGVQVAAPAVVRDYTVAQNPVRLDIGATVVDDKGRVLAGSVPLHVRVVDPLGVLRFELYRATEQGQFRVSLPLAVNDAGGPWKVTVRELLANTEGAATFAYQPPAQCGALAGAVPRAVYFGNERENIFRFFATHKDVTIVAGTGDYNSAAAERLAAGLLPWDVRSKIVAAADVNKPRTMSAEEAPAWCGLEPGRVTAGQKAGVAQVGFDVRGSVILLGTPEDNPLIKFLADARFLPYKLDKVNFPGPGRGMMAWQRDGIVYGQESIALIAYDAAGMNEAVGSVYEAAAALDPLMQWTPPARADVASGKQAPATPPAAPQMWQVAFADRAVGLRGQANGNLAVLTQDGTVAALDPTGKAVWQKTVDCGDELKHGASADGSVLAVGAAYHLVAFGGDGKQLFDLPFEFETPGAQPGKKRTSPITAVAVSPDGKSIAAGAANGRLLLLDNRGNRKWEIGGVTGEELAKWDADVKAWEAGAAEREAADKQYKEAEAKWKEDLKQWEAGGKKDKQPQQPKRPNLPGKPNRPAPVPYLGAAFSSDGSTLLAITKDQGHLIATADGKIGAKVGGVAPAFRPVRVGDNLLVTDGRERLALVSPADGKTLGELRFVQKVQAPGKKPGEMMDSKDAAVSAAVLNGTLLVATEFDGTVRALKEVKGKVEEQTQWSFKVPQRLTKKIAVGDGLVAVAYWGGTLRILDATGAVKFAQTLPQDVAAMTWAGKTLVVGLADGRILALDAK